MCFLFFPFSFGGEGLEMHRPMKFSGCDLLAVSYSLFFSTFGVISPNIGTV
jgi:hypothetical protein